MLSGFASVPRFKFVAPQIPVVEDAFASLSEAIVVSLLDKQGIQSLAGVLDELASDSKSHNISR